MYMYVYSIQLLIHTSVCAFKLQTFNNFLGKTPLVTTCILQGKYVPMGVDNHWQGRASHLPWPDKFFHFDHRSDRKLRLSQIGRRKQR